MSESIVKVVAEALESGTFDAEDLIFDVHDSDLKREQKKELIKQIRTADSQRLISDVEYSDSLPFSKQKGCLFTGTSFRGGKFEMSAKKISAVLGVGKHPAVVEAVQAWAEQSK